MLTEVNYSLPNIELSAKQKTKSVRFTQKPDHPRFSVSKIGYASQEACLVIVPTGGYLNSFTLYVHKRGEGNIEDQLGNFILFDNDNGMPGRVLIRSQIKAVLNNKRLIFDLGDNTMFLPAGKYFMGFEYFKIKPAVPDKVQSAENDVPRLFIEYRKTKEPELYYQMPLSKWKEFAAPHSQIKNDNIRNFYSFGYEIKMEIPVKN